MSNRKIRGIAIHRPIVYGSTARIMSPEEAGESGHTHRWTVCVRSAASPEPTDAQKSGAEPAEVGGADDLTYFIKKVSFKLHETYPTPLRNVDKPPFEVTETGWGEFEIQIRIYFVNEANEKPLLVSHHLKLHPWAISSTIGPNNITAGPKAATPVPPPRPASTEPTPAPEASTSGEQAPKEEEGMAVDLATTPAVEEAPPAPAPTVVVSPVHSFQYDEVVFTDPTEAFLNTLMSYPPTPLPPKPRLPKPDPLLPIGAGGAIGELTMETEHAESERLEHARLQVLAEIDTMRKQMYAHEQTMEKLKAGTAAALA